METRTKLFKFSTVRTALVGALVLIVAQAAFNYQDFAHLSPQALTGSGVAGFVIGWMYEVALDLLGEVHQAQKKMAELSRLLEYQQGPLQMLTKTHRHAPALGVLLKDSILDNYKHIAYVSTTRYLSYLNEALKNSDKFQGSQRDSIRWFKQQDDGEQYLHNLRDHKMQMKTRIFIVDDVQAMKEDLEDQALMDFYWTNTGDVRTFWISVAAFESAFHDLPCRKTSRYTMANCSSSMTARSKPSSSINCPRRLRKTRSSSVSMSKCGQA